MTDKTYMCSVIPKQFEDIFVDNIARHAKEGIVLSWAKIGETLK